MAEGHIMMLVNLPLEQLLPLGKEMQEEMVWLITQVLLHQEVEVEEQEQQVARVQVEMQVLEE